MEKNKDKARDYLDKKLPFELEVCRVGLDKVLEKVWEITYSKECDRAPQRPWSSRK